MRNNVRKNSKDSKRFKSKRMPEKLHRRKQERRGRMRSKLDKRQQEKKLRNLKNSK